MKKSLSLSLVLSLLLASCTVGDSVDTDDAVITESRAVSDSDTADTSPTIDDYINGDLPLPSTAELQLLGDDFGFYTFDNGNCTVVYNERGAWVFDYISSAVTPMVDLDEMFGKVDPTGRGAKYFTDVTIKYEFEEKESLLYIHHTVTAKDDPECSFKVTSFYYKGERRSHGGYNFKSVKYPGYDEPIIMKSFEEFEAYNEQTKVYYEDNFIGIFKLMLENDTSGLEEEFGLKEGTLDSWKGTVITDHTIVREMPIMDYTRELCVEFTIEKSTLERYPEGRYRLSNGGTMESTYKIERIDADTPDEPSWSEEKTAAVKWALTWGKSYGSADEEDQNIAREPYNQEYTFAHLVYDYFVIYIAPAIAGDQNAQGNNITGNMYREYAEKYLNMKNFENSYTAYGDKLVEHGGHGGSRVLADMADYSYENGVHYVTVNYYADPFKSVIAKINRFAMVEADHGIYAVHHTDFLYDSELYLYTEFST